MSSLDDHIINCWTDVMNSCKHLTSEHKQQVIDAYITAYAAYIQQNGHHRKLVGTPQYEQQIKRMYDFMTNYALDKAEALMFESELGNHIWQGVKDD